MARLIAGAAVGKPFLEPDKVFGIAHLGKSGVDEWASALLKFPNGILAEVSCSVSLAQDNVLRILGTTGRIEVKDFWFAVGREGGLGRITIIAPDGIGETITWRKRAGSIPSRSTRPARPSAPEGRNSRRRA